MVMLAERGASEWLLSICELPARRRRCDQVQITSKKGLTDRVSVLTRFQPALSSSIEGEDQNTSFHCVNSLYANLGQVQIRNPAEVSFTHPVMADN